MDDKAVGALLDIGCKGIVLAGLGQGNAPASVLDALQSAASEGVPIVRSSRVDEGMVDRNVEVDDDTRGIVAARALGPAKSRIPAHRCWSRAGSPTPLRYRRLSIGRER